MRQIVFLFYEGMTALDAIGHEILSRIPGAKLAGQPLAEALQLGLEYDPAPPFDAGSPKKANSALVEGLKARLLEQFEPA